MRPIARCHRSEGAESSIAVAKENAVSINSTRSLLYQIARLLGDVNAVQKGRVGKRIGRRLAGKITGRGLGRLFR